jgi:pyridoxamine 5'-phosphate oxidase
MEMDDIHRLRLDYRKGELDLGDLPEDPLRAFSFWFEEAMLHCVEPNAMCLATADREGRPSARMVLLKGLDRGGFMFFTNYLSRKGLEIDVNPHAALVFYWEALERQVRVEGILSRLSPEENDNYFHSRPHGSQIGAWASMQSESIESREKLEAQLAHFTQLYPEGKVPRPPHWGGFHLMPSCLEFWQGRSNRLHDRIQYRLPEHGNGWERVRLSP